MLRSPCAGQHRVSSAGHRDAAVRVPRTRRRAPAPGPRRRPRPSRRRARASPAASWPWSASVACARDGISSSEARSSRPSAATFVSSTASAAQRAASIQAGSSRRAPARASAPIARPFQPRDHLAVDGRRLERGAAGGVAGVVAALAAGAVDPRLRVLGGAEAAARLLQHVDEEPGDAARDVVPSRRRRRWRRRAAGRCR